MPSLLVALMVLVILVIGLGAVLLGTKTLRAETDKAQAARQAGTPSRQD
jgi:hypothetical protein